jgi:hypothetical protein
MGDRNGPRRCDAKTLAAVTLADHGRLGVDDHADVLDSRRFRHQRRRGGGHVAEVERLAVDRDGAGVGAGEQQQVVDEGAEADDLGVDVVEWALDVRDRRVGMAPDVLE